MPAFFSTYPSRDLTIIALHGGVPIKELLTLIHEYKNSGFSKYEIHDLQVSTAIL